MTFEQFMAKANAWVASVAGGMTTQDFADAGWRDLYEDLGDEVTREDVFAELAEWDDLFAAMLDNQGIEY